MEGNIVASTPTESQKSLKAKKNMSINKLIKCVM